MDEELSIGNDVTMRGGSAASVGRIDQYELVRELGGGGFGCVYLAKDTVAGIEVAVKGLPPEVRHNKEELENIRANFALVSRLHHPNIAAALVLHPAKEVSYANRDAMEKLRVFERDTMMVMEYAPGVTLSQWRKQFPEKKVPFTKALDITRQVAAALDYAHEEKIVHRDVKPSNVMIETRQKVEKAGGGGGEVVARVLDFGLAAEIRSSMGRVSREIRDTSGTRPYMAPEQWRGAKQGPATDQYALAAMFCELVTGEVPFASVFETGDPVLMKTAVATDAPEFPKELPKAVRLALAKALSKKSEERFATCTAFADALESSGRARTPASPLKWITISVILLALAAGGGWWWHERVKSEELRVKNEALAAERARQAEETKRKAEEAKRKAEEARLAAEKAEAERKAKAEAEQKAKLEAEQKAKAEAERLAEEKRKAEETRIAEEKRKAAEAAKPVPQKMLEALGAMGLDFTKCERDEYAALGIPLMTEIHSCYRNYTALFEERQKLLNSLTENHPDVIAFGPRIELAKKTLTETIARSAGLVEKYADRYECDLQNAVEALKDDVLAYEFFERKLPVSLKLKLRGAYSDYLSAVRKRRELLKTFTEAHPDVVASDVFVRKAEESFKADVRAFMVAKGWLKDEPVRTKFRQYVPQRDQESIDLARKLYAVRDSGTHYVENAIEGYVDDGALPGAISVACCDGEQEVSCLGWADVEQRRRMSLDSMFMIASQSKGVCGVAVAMLIEEGLLTLDDRVDKYVPEFGNLQVEENQQGKSALRPATTPLTLRHLLNNTAGFPFDLPERKERGWMSLTIAEAVERTAKMPLLSDPGTANKYSNLGFEIAARIVEVVSGQPYEDFVKSRILDPLGMKDTTFNPTNEQLDRSIALYSVSSGAKAVRQRENSWSPLPHNGPTVKVSAAAGLWSTARDQLRFYKMLMNLGLSEDGTRILKEETVRNLLAVSSHPRNLDGDVGYSLGFAAPVNDGDDAWFGHGGAWGTNCMVNWHKRQLKLWVVQLVGGPRPWDKDRQGALERFFLSRKAR